MFDVKAKKLFLRPSVRYTWTPLVPPAVFTLPCTKALIHTHTMAKQHCRPFLLNQPLNPNFTESAPIPKWRSQKHRSSPHYVAFVSNAAEH